MYRNRHTACADSYALIIRKISWCSSTCIMGVKADRIRKRKKHQRTKSWMCYMKFKCIKLLLSNWFSKWAVKNWFYSVPISNVVTMVPYSDTSQNYCSHWRSCNMPIWSLRKMKSPDWCTHPGFCRIPQPSKWEIDLRSSLHKPVGVAVTCAKTHNKFIKPPSTLYPETTGKIWSLHKFFCCFFF